MIFDNTGTKYLDLINELPVLLQILPQLRPITVLEAFQAAALSVDAEINAVCDFILEARDWALELETVAETERGALYGLPFSVKVRSEECGEE